MTIYRNHYDDTKIRDWKWWGECKNQSCSRKRLYLANQSRHVHGICGKPHPKCHGWLHTQEPGYELLQLLMPVQVTWNAHRHILQTHTNQNLKDLCLLLIILVKVKRNSSTFIILVLTEQTRYSILKSDFKIWIYFLLKQVARLAPFACCLSC